MSIYTHLAHEERYQIYALEKAGLQQNEIAALLGRSPSPISRELHHYRSRRGYRPKQAQQIAQECAWTSRSRRRITGHQWRAIATLVRREWSPEQITERAAPPTLMRTFTSLIRMPRGSVVSTRTPTVLSASTCRSPVNWQRSLAPGLARSKIASTIGPTSAWAA